MKDVVRKLRLFFLCNLNFFHNLDLVKIKKKKIFIVDFPKSVFICFINQKNINIVKQNPKQNNLY